MNKKTRRPAKRSTAPETQTIRVTIDRMCCGRTCGKTGTTVYEWTDGKEHYNQIQGVSLETILGRELEKGTVLDVTVTVVKRSRKKTINPWLTNG